MRIRQYRDGKESGSRSVVSGICSRLGGASLARRALLQTISALAPAGRRFRKVAGLLCATLALCDSAFSATYTVTSNADTTAVGTLRWAIAQANANAGSTINLNDNLGTITLTSAMDIITTSVTINGGTGNSVSGAEAYRIFFVNTANSTDAVNISNLNLIDGYAKGGDGGPSGGGGMGAGGALFVSKGAVRIANVNFSGNTAQGGSGGDGATNGAPTAGGGGGLGGDGGDGSYLGGGGGGGYGGNGGTGVNSGAGGGGGITGNGGNGSSSQIGGGGGGVANGGTPAGGSGGGGNGTSSSTAFATSGSNGGGGGGGAFGVNPNNSAVGGNGGTYGGGGGSATDSGGGSRRAGSGGDFGGGGGIAGIGVSTQANVGGNGGYGGGGGGASFTVASPSAAGNGGFGGGGGGAVFTGGVGGDFGGSGGFYRKNTQGDYYAAAGGGGGAGLGGAVFVRSDNGASLVYAQGTVSGGQVIAGAAGYSPVPSSALTLTAATSGQALGDAFFLSSGDTTFEGGTVNGVIAGVDGASLLKTTSGILVLNGTNSYNGGTTIANGTLLMGNANALGTSGNITFAGGTLQFGASGTLNYSSRLAQTGTNAYRFDTNGQNVTLVSNVTGGDMVTSGSGLLRLTGSNNFTGISLNDGVLQLASPNAIGTISTLGNITFAGGTLQFTSANTMDYSVRFNTGAGMQFRLDTNGRNVTLAAGLTSAGGSLTKLGTGLLSITGSTNYTGATTVSAGTLRMTNATPSSAFAIAAGATLDFNITTGSGISSADTIFSGSGTLIKSGTGSIVWSTSAATFALAKGSLIDVQGGTFTGGSFGNEDWTANQSNLNVAAGATFNAVEANVRVDALTGSGTVTSGVVGGTNTFTVGIGGSSSTFSGVIANNPIGGGLANLVKEGAGTLTLTGNNTYSGGTTITSGTLELGSAGALGTSGTITFAGGGLRFSASNATDYSSRFSNEAYGTRYRIDTNGQNVTFAANLNADGGMLFKSGEGTLTLTGTDVFTGGVYLLGGSLTAGSDSAFGPDTGLSFAGGTLRYSASNLTDYSGIFSHGSNSPYRIDTNGQSVSFASDVDSLGGTLTKLGSGTLTLNAGVNSYTGATTVSQGTLRVTGGLVSNTFFMASGAILDLNVASGSRDATALSTTNSNTFTGSGTLLKTGIGSIRWGAGAGTFQMAAGSLIDVQGGDFYGGSNGNEVWTANQSGLNVAAGANFYGVEANVRVDALTGSGQITSGYTGTSYQGFTFGVADGSGTFSGVLADHPGFSGNFTKSGTGTQILTGANTYTGTTTVSGGTLQIGTGGTTGALASSAIVNHATLVFNRGGTSSLAGVISGSGAFQKDGAGLLSLSGSNSYTGTTAVTAGTLRLQNATASPAFAIAAGAALDFNITTNSGDNGANTVFSGSGTLIKSGTGGLVWSTSAATFALAKGSLIDVQAGTFTGGSNGNEVWTSNQSSLNVAAGAHFSAVEANVRVDALTGSGTISSGFTGGNTLTFGVADGSGAFAGILSNNPIGNGLGNFAKSGTGTQILTGANTYTGTTTISGGILQIGDGGTAGTLASSTIVNNASLAFNRSDASSYNGAISGGGSLTKSGPGALTLGGTNSYTGGTMVNSGTLIGTSASLQGAIVNNASTIFDQTTSGTYAGTMSGTGALTKTGAATLTVSGSNTYRGGTTISGGTLVKADNGAVGTGTVVVEGGVFFVENGVAVENAVTLSGGEYDRALASSAHLANAVNATSSFAGGHADTTAKILDGILTSGTTLQTSFATTSSALNDEIRLSDVYSLHGTGTDIFVLELSMTSIDVHRMLGWLDPNGNWVNAVLGNTGPNDILFIEGAYDGDLVLGHYGVDTTTGSVWAVLDHNSDFAAVVPEPCTLVLMAIGGTTMFLFRRRRA
ncbi:hypothetical protein BH09VER1_BH09VER1_09670 [soil metagenome]